MGFNFETLPRGEQWVCKRKAQSTAGAAALGEPRETVYCVWSAPRAKP